MNSSISKISVLDDAILDEFRTQEELSSPDLSSEITRIEDSIMEEEIDENMYTYTWMIIPYPSVFA